MRTVRARAGIPAVLMLLAACNGGSSGTAGDGSTLATPPRSSVTVAGGGTLAPAERVTTLPGKPADDASADSAVDGPVQIDVMVGVDSGPDRIERVKVGADITLNITNPDADDEFHVHGVDIEQKVAAGVTATINFTVDQPGTYEVESHVTNDVLLVIEVQ